MQNEKNDFDEIGFALEKLEHISYMLRSFSMMLVAITVMNLFITMLIMSGINRAFNSLSSALLFSVIPIVFGILAVLVAFWFDMLKRDGDAYFEELSDELHGKKIKESNEIYKNDSSLKARVIIRRYSAAASLPLIPGKYGPAILSAANIVFSFLAALIGVKFY